MRTLNNKMVRIEDKTIKTLASFKEPRKVKVLFEESYFNSKEEDFQVVCIERPLEGGTISLFQTSSQLIFQSLEDCCNFLDDDHEIQTQIKEMRQKIFCMKLSLKFTSLDLNELVERCYFLYQESFSVFFLSFFFLFSFFFLCIYFLIRKI